MGRSVGTWLLGLLWLAAPGFAQDTPNARGLLERAFSNLYGDDYIQTMVLSATVGAGRPLERALQISRMQSERPGKALLRFLEPGEVRRTSVLLLENASASDDLWIYLPALKRSRRVSSSQRADSFFGTDLSYEDIEPKRAENYDVEVAENATKDARCIALEIVAREHFDSTYDKTVSCIEPERALILWTEFYRRGKQTKRLEIDVAAVRKVRHRFVPFDMTMRADGGRSTTHVRTKGYRLVDTLPASLFTMRNLESGDAKRDRRRAGKTLAAEE